MTDIDLTAATEAARSVPIVDWLAEPIRLTKDEAHDILTAALPHILAQVEARVTPSRGELIALLNREFGAFLAHSPYNPERFWGQPADAVLALLPGKTEQEVRADMLDRLIDSYFRADKNLFVLPASVVHWLRAQDEYRARYARGGERG